MYRLLLFLFLIGLSGTSLARAQEADDWPSLGMHLYYPNYYDGVSYFTEATRHASDWISFTLESDEWTDNRAIPQTETGYPTELAADQGARMILYIESTVAPSGDYTLTWAGDGTVRVVYDFEPLVTFNTEDVPQQRVSIPEANMTHLFIEVTKTTPADPVRDIRLWLPGYGPESDAMFRPEFLERLEPFEPIRLTDWGQTNVTDIESWEQRSQMDWFSWGVEEGPFRGGVPYEVQIELANTTGKDMWVSVPHAATDDFVRQLATLIRDQLAPDLRVWVEYTNEGWNPAFPQNWWLFEQSQAIAEAENNEEFFLFHYYGRRTAEVLAIFDEVFADAPDRIVGILSAQSAWGYPAEAALVEIERMGAMWLVDALAIAPYIPNNLEDGTWNLDALITEMDSDALTEENYAAIFAELERAVDGIFSGENEYAEAMRINRDLAQQHDLALITYEAGQHLTAYNLEDFTPLAEIEGVYNQVNARPEMYDSYLRYLDQWREFGGETMVMFHMVGSWNEVETFGHLATIDQPLDEAHKFRALLDWLGTN